MSSTTQALPTRTGLGEIVSEVSRIREWRARGATLTPNDRRELDVEQLIQFAQLARDTYPDQPVTVTVNGDLRVVDYRDQDGGPWLDWRD